MLTSIGTKPQTLKDIRLNHHISLNDLAYESNVSRHAVLRMEQLCYQSPLPAVITGLSDITGISEFELEDAYLEDVRLNRIFSGSTYFAHRGLINEALEFADSFQQWRELLFKYQHQPTSRIFFSGAVSVHPATLDKYESHNSGFPEPLAVALTQCGLGDSILDYFKGHKRFNRIED